MITNSIWGPVPRTYSRLLDRYEIAFPQIRSACVIGAADGRFVLPLVRRGIYTVCYDVDRTALFGGEKIVPVPRKILVKQGYVPADRPTTFPKLPMVMCSIIGLSGRIANECLSAQADIRCEDFFRHPPAEQFDFVFTSCSMQYKGNRDLDAVEMVETTKKAVEPQGVVAIEYMMPLQDDHVWKAPQFYRPGVMAKIFKSDGWHVLSIREPSHPRFEAAHVDRPADHFHRVGRIIARRVA